MGMRDWLIIIVIIGIVVILLDGYRRKRKDSIRVKLEKIIPDFDEGADENALAKAELPNGGARVKPRNYQPTDTSGAKHGSHTNSEQYPRYVEADNDDAETEENEEDEENVPVLMDAVDIEGRNESSKPGTAGAESAGMDDADYYNDTIEDDDSSDAIFAVSPDYVTSDKTDDTDESEAADIDDTDDAEESARETLITEQAGRRIAEQNSRPAQERQGRIEPTFAETETFSAEELEDKPEHLKARKGTPEKSAARKAEGKPSAEKKSAPAAAQAELFSESPKDFIQEDSEQEEAYVGPEEVIVINVMAKHGEMFAGRDLLPILLQQGMRLGSMSIFHKHRDSQGNGPVMFSMANMVKPGTFDVSQMEEFTTPGVSFFLQLPNSLGNMKCFEQMLNAANAIKQTLNGDLKDENRSVITRQTIEHCRQRIQDFELAQLSRK